MTRVQLLRRRNHQQKLSAVYQTCLRVADLSEDLLKFFQLLFAVRFKHSRVDAHSLELGVRELPVPFFTVESRYEGLSFGNCVVEYLLCEHFVE